MKQGKIQLLLNNSRELDGVGGFFTSNVFRKCNALTITLRNEKADAIKINQAIKIVKENSSVLSNFRGNNLLTIATTLSFQEDMNGSFKEIFSIYEKLKDKFFTNEYLVLAAIVIFNSRDRVSIDGAINNTRVVYDYMKSNHFFLTGSEDICAAAMIAVTSDNMERTLKETEDYYTALKYNGFFAGNNLQSLSHMLPLFSGNIEDNITKVINMDKALRINRVPLKSYALPLLAVAAIIAKDVNVVAKEVKETSDLLKEEKGFGFSLGSVIRNMIAVGIVASSYIDELGEEERQSLINAANNVALTVQIAIEVAASAAAAGAAASASASN